MGRLYICIHFQVVIYIMCRTKRVHQKSRFIWVVKLPYLTDVSLLLWSDYWFWLGVGCDFRAIPLVPGLLFG